VLTTLDKIWLTVQKVLPNVTLSNSEVSTPSSASPSSASHVHRMSVMSKSFSSLGGDSLAVTQFVAHLHNVYNIRIPITSVMADVSLTQLGTKVDDARGFIDTSITPSNFHDEVDQVWHQLQADINTRFGTSDRQTLGDIKTKINEAVTSNGEFHILFTGATGFLGTHLLQSLLFWDEDLSLRLDSLPSSTIVHVHCLVRASNDDDAMKRIVQSQEIMWDRTRHRVDQIHAIAADITLPTFGLDIKRYSSLIPSINLIVHNAAIVSSLAPYSVLKGKP
jgi:hypothetical protein